MKEKEDAKTEEVELGETVELQIVMALDDVGIVATDITPKQVTVKKKDLKKEKSLLQELLLITVQVNYLMKIS